MSNAQLVRDFREVRVRMIKRYYLNGHALEPGSLAMVPACEAVVMVRGGFAERIEPERAVKYAEESRIRWKQFPH